MKMAIILITRPPTATNKITIKIIPTLNLLPMLIQRNKQINWQIPNTNKKKDPHSHAPRPANTTSYQPLTFAYHPFLPHLQHPTTTQEPPSRPRTEKMGYSGRPSAQESSAGVEQVVFGHFVFPARPISWFPPFFSRLTNRFCLSGKAAGWRAFFSKSVRSGFSFETGGFSTGLGVCGYFLNVWGYFFFFFWLFLWEMVWFLRIFFLSLFLITSCGYSVSFNYLNFLNL